MTETEALDITPLCASHAEMWYCSRNHIRSQSGCVFCDSAIAEMALSMLAGAVARIGTFTTEELVADMKDRAKKFLDAQTVTIESSPEEFK